MSHTAYETEQAAQMRSFIRKTKHKIPLTDTEIRTLIRLVTEDSVPAYQVSAWLMAVCFAGLTDEETQSLTLAMRDSGQTMHWDTLGGAVCDKHSTGGVGDKTTLILAPICAACGVYMPKMSGRGLGHTGGTIDKLESIPGLRTDLAPDAFLHLVEQNGCAVAMQTGNLAPADKKLYALRDVTETVESTPLICASIMSKKLATGADHILLDVKVGSGAFMKTDAEAAELSRLMLMAAKAAGRSCTAVLTDMDRPLGMYIGNALEVQEAIDVLRGEGNQALADFCITMSAELLRMAGKGDAESCREMAAHALTSGAALERFRRMVEGQGGDPRVTEHTELLPKARYTKVVYASQSGWITGMESETVGRASVALGAGRLTKEDAIDPAAGIVLTATVGDEVRAGDPVMTLYADDMSRFEAAEHALADAVVISQERPAVPPLIHAAAGSARFHNGAF